MQPSGQDVHSGTFEHPHLFAVHKSVGIILRTPITDSYLCHLYRRIVAEIRCCDSLASIDSFELHQQVRYSIRKMDVMWQPK